MSQFFQIHPENPQSRLINQAVDIIKQGGVVVYPTDSAYALGCHLGDKKAMERIRRIRKLTEKHNFTLMCRDLSELATYAVVDNSVYRMIKHVTPGPYTFILKASREVPRRLLQAKRKTIGLRVPDNVVSLALLEALGEPMMSVSLILPGDDYPEIDPYIIRDSLEHDVDLVIDGGFCGMEMTTVVDLADDDNVNVIREGKGELSALGL